jgi:GcrA cell cycle regulator
MKKCIPYILYLMGEDKMAWTDDRVEILTKLWGEGLSASQIARELGDVTRNAVIGKVHRLGLAGRASPTRPKSRIRHREPSNFSSNFSSKDRYNENLKPLSLPEPAVNSDGKPINILMLTEKICKWPIGEPSDENFRFCGLNRVQGSVYCEEHTKVAYQPLETRRKKKVKFSAKRNTKTNIGNY